MRSVTFWCGLFVVLCLGVLVQAAPERTRSPEGARAIIEIDSEAASWAALAAEIRASQNFNDLKDRMAAWADAQKDRVKSRKHSK